MRDGNKKNQKHYVLDILGMLTNIEHKCTQLRCLT